MNLQATETKARERIIIALDLSTGESALALMRKLSPHAGLFKIGLQLYTAAGPDIVRAVRDLGGRIFLDLKLHDIPNTVGRAVESAALLGVEMQTIHLSGGRAMVDAAVRAAPPEMLLLGVTVLTSVDQAALHETGVDSPIENQVLRLTQLGVDCGIGGVVASPLEIAPLRQIHGSTLQIVTPGIRPRDAATNDQKRTLTPAEALRAGADFLVIGRPITAAPDPCAALEQIVADAI